VTTCAFPDTSKSRDTISIKVHEEILLMPTPTVRFACLMKACSPVRIPNHEIFCRAHEVGPIHP